MAAEKKRNPIDNTVGNDEFWGAQEDIVQMHRCSAKSTLKNVIKKRPDAASPHYHLGWLYIQWGCMNKTLTHFEQAANLKPEITKYKQVQLWFTRYFHISKCNFFDTVKQLLYDINPRKFPFVHNLTNHATISALQDAIILYHDDNQDTGNHVVFFKKEPYDIHVSSPIYHRPGIYVPNVQQFVVKKYYRLLFGLHMKYYQRNLCNVHNYHKYIMEKSKRKSLINGYIHKSSDHISFCDGVICLIEMFYAINEHIFIWGFASNETNYLYPVEKLSPPKQERLFHFWLVNKNSSLMIEFPHAYRVRNAPFSYLKVYYEMQVFGVEKINFWKGTIKCTQFPTTHGTNCRNRKILPARYMNWSDLSEDVEIKYLMRFLGVKWHHYENYFENIKMKKTVTFDWTISNGELISNLKHKPEWIKFSDNFDNNNWCIYCEKIGNPTMKKKK
eukprot:465177_1